MRMLRPDVFLQYAEHPEGVWVVSAAAGQWVVAITSGSMELNVNNKPVLCTEPDVPGCDELGRVLAKLTPRKQPQRKKALPDLRARFNIISKNGAR